MKELYSLTAMSVDELLCSKIVIAGINSTDISYMRAMLEICGFSNVHSVYSSDELLNCLRSSIHDEHCGVDLVILDSELPGITAQSLSMTMSQFEEWHLISIISLTRAVRWDYKQSLVEQTYGVSSFLYTPKTAESLPPIVMTTLAHKKERKLSFQKRIQLEEELANLKIMEARLQFSVEHDELTGLFNRKKLESSLVHTIKQAQDFNTTSVLFYIDLDRFKVLNDGEGHQVGDSLLIQLSNSFRSFFSPLDLLVRIGSDEFAVLIENVDETHAYELAEKLRAMLDGYSFAHMGTQYHLSACIGVELIRPQDKGSAGDILAHANQACYTAKRRGRNRVHLYDTGDREMDTLRYGVHWAPRIRQALKYQHFDIHFQPILSVKNNQISHYECLIRMRDGDGKMYYPSDFIPVAEAMGLIQQIDLWVVNHVFDLLDSFPEHLSFTINLSGNIFLDRRLYDLVERKLVETGVNPNRVVFEITETLAISNFDKTKAMVNKLRSLGCQFALDDFGAGFNSYSYLKHLPVDILKIDGSFITELENDAVDQLLVKSMIDVAHSLGKKTVAEFVEHPTTMDLLTSLGIDYVQGYLIGKPQPELLEDSV